MATGSLTSTCPQASAPGDSLLRFAMKRSKHSEGFSWARLRAGSLLRSPSTDRAQGSDVEIAPTLSTSDL
jgi:hypothetical protein